jgi:hypothetical protein
MFSIGFLTLDILIILAIFIGAFFVTFQGGKKKIVKIILPVYPTLLLYPALPLNISDATAQVVVFVLIYGLIYVVLRKNFTAPNNHSGGRRFFDATLLSIASVFILLIIYYRIIPLDSLYELKLPFSAYLQTTIPLYVTLLIPIVVLLMTNRRDD